MKNPVIAIPSFVISMIVYVLSPIFFEMNYNVFGEGVNYIVSDQSDKTLNDIQQPQLLEKECKSPCPEFDEMCITICA